MNFYQTEKRLCKFVKRSTKGKSPIVRRKTFQRACILSTPQEREDAEKYKELYTNPRSFMMRIDARVEGICPGFQQRP